MKNRSMQISFAIIFLIIGIVSAVQFKSTQKNNSILTEKAKSIQEVQAQLLRQKEYTESLLNQIEEYQKKINSYEKNVNVEDIMKKDLEKARMLAGMSDVVGKGIIITIDDTKVPSEIKGLPPMDRYIVTDANLLELLNELRAAGAEAMSINEERILATTEVRKAGLYIRINNRNYNSPFVIKAIGDPNVMEGALKIRDGIIEYLTVNKVDVKIERSDNVFIPKFKGVINSNYLNKK